MGLLTDTKEFILQTKTIDHSLTGAINPVWKDCKTIKVALYLTNQVAITTNVQFDKYDYVGISFTKLEPNKKYRIKNNDEIYFVDKMINVGLKTFMYLKRVDTDA